MTPKPIGIIGGAGPLAGSYLLERVISLSMKNYGCYKDSDFPKIFLISFPFSEMLSQEINSKKVRSELSACLNQLRESGAQVLAIACNTLHVFLEEKDQIDDLIQLPQVVVKELLPSENPLIFCTSTSVNFGLHKQFFPCTYPDFQTQEHVDYLIDQILRGANKKLMLNELGNLIQEQKEDTVILGCTELSLYAAELTISNKRIIDPLEVVAKEILKKVFYECNQNTSVS